LTKLQNNLSLQFLSEKKWEKFKNVKTYILDLSRFLGSDPQSARLWWLAAAKLQAASEPIA